MFDKTKHTNQRDEAQNRDSNATCLSCARKGRTCCQGHDIYVTLGDCRRIGYFNGAVDFFEFRGCCHAGYADQGDDPLWQQHVFRKDGSRRVLKNLADGNCIFLGPGGCDLPLAVRPLVCRLYPHLYSAGRIIGRWDDECPAASTQDRSLMEKGIAGVKQHEAEQWHRMLYTEILWEAHADENRPDL